MRAPARITIGLTALTATLVLAGTQVEFDESVDFNKDPYVPANADDAIVADQVARSDAVFFGGGDQMRYVRTLFDCEFVAVPDRHPLEPQRREQRLVQLGPVLGQIAGPELSAKRLGDVA